MTPRNPLTHLREARSYGAHMADLRKMTVEGLRELARKVLGPGHTRLKTKGELLAALEGAGKEPAKPPPAKASAKPTARPSAGAAARAPKGGKPTKAPVQAEAPAPRKAAKPAKGSKPGPGAKAVEVATKAARAGARVAARAG